MQTSCGTPVLWDACPLRRLLLPVSNMYRILATRRSQVSEYFEASSPPLCRFTYLAAAGAAGGLSTWTYFLLWHLEKSHGKRHIMDVRDSLLPIKIFPFFARTGTLCFVLFPDRFSWPSSAPSTSTSRTKASRRASCPSTRASFASTCTCELRSMLMRSCFTLLDCVIFQTWLPVKT